MSSGSVILPLSGVPTFPSVASFPPAAAAGNGALAIDLSTNILYESDGTNWLVLSNPLLMGGITGLMGDVSATGPGIATATVNSVGGSSSASIHTAELLANAATSSNTPSTIIERDVSGNFVASNITANLTGTASGNPPNSRLINTTAPLLGGGDLSTDLTLSMHIADPSHDGYLSSTDFNTFAAKQNALTTGNLTDAGTDGITVTGGTGAVIGTGTSLSQQASDATHNGYLKSVDWSTFNGKQASLTIGNLTDAGTDGITITNGTGSVIGTGTSVSQHVSDATHNGYLSSVDWSTFNNKLNKSAGNYITNPDAEVDTAGWNLYNNSGNTAQAFVVAQDITYTAVAAGNAGNGINIEYIYNAAFPAATPNINVISSTHVQVRWNNGPTVSNNPTATQLKAAWDAVGAATAIATTVITGTASKLQYITGANITANGGDTAPTTGTGGVPSGVTITRTTVNPLVGLASFDLGKIAANEQGQGVSTDFTINSVDKGNTLQVSFAYSGSAGMVLGANSDVEVFIYDITNAVLIPVTPLNTIAGPVSTAKVFVGQFKSVSTSVSYRLILHISTTSSVAWDFEFDNVVVSGILNPTAATQVPSVVLPAQPISGAVTDHMVVMWLDGGSSWIPATITGTTVTDVTSLLGFATNIVGLVADIYVAGQMDGFSFGPFVGFNQYIDNIAGGLSPLPSPFNDNYVSVGKAVTGTILDIEFIRHVDQIGVKGGLLTNTGANDGTGDVVLPVGANGNVLVANSAAAKGINWAPAVVAGTGLTYTTSTRSLTLANLAGDVTGAPGTNTIAAATVTGKLITGFVSGAGVVAATDTILQAIDKIVGNIALKAPLASPTFTGDVNVSTGNLLISTIGKGLQVKTGANAKIGTAVLVAGTVTVANTSVTANSRIFVTSNTDGGTPGWLRVSAKTVGTSFVITSSSAIDTSTVAWYIVESIP